MKRLLRPLFVACRRWVLTSLRKPVAWYYRIIWMPKPGSLEERLHKLAVSHPGLTVIQVGANDGFQNDPLCKFIKTYRWKGLCFEPQPEAYRQLRSLYSRDLVTPIHAAISEREGQQDLYKISFTTQRWASGLSSFDRNHLQQQIDNGYVEGKCQKYGITPPQDRATWITAIPVQTMTFAHAFKQHQLNETDLLHIDTEGFDYEVFKLFPFDHYRPTAVLIETAHLGPTDRESLESDLQKMGYALTQYGVDLWAQKG